MNNEVIAEVLALAKNETVSEFVKTEAYKKIASDISNMPGRTCTEAAARVIVHANNPAIEARWNEYCLTGYVACIAAKREAA